MPVAFNKTGTGSTRCKTHQSRRTPMTAQDHIESAASLVIIVSIWFLWMSL